MKKFELQQWALAAEVVGGIAVVVTLIFLALETRENTNAIQAQTYQALTSELNTVRRTMGEPEYFRIFIKLIKLEYESLSEEEQITYIFLAGAKWGVYESAFYARERGILGENEWGRFSDAICRNLVFDKPFWDSQDQQLVLSVGKISYGISSGLTPNFKNYVETLCEPGLSQEEVGTR